MATIAEKALRAGRLRKERRMMLTSVDESYLGVILLGDLKVTWPRMPGDAVYLGAHLDLASMSVCVRWGHESFPVTPPGTHLRHLDVDVQHEWIDPEEEEPKDV